MLAVKIADALSAQPSMVDGRESLWSTEEVGEHWTLGAELAWLSGSAARRAFTRACDIVRPQKSPRAHMTAADVRGLTPLIWGHVLFFSYHRQHLIEGCMGSPEDAAVGAAEVEDHVEGGGDHASADHGCDDRRRAGLRR